MCTKLGCFNMDMTSRSLAFLKKILQTISLSKHMVTFGTLLWSHPKWFLWSIHSISNNLGLDIQSNKLDFILPKYYFCQVWLDLAWFWIERMKCKKVYDNDIQRTNKQWSSFFNYTFEGGKLKKTHTNIKVCNIKRRVQTELSLGLCSKSRKAVSAQLHNLCKRMFW